MVSTRPFGRLGNEIFKLAAIIGYANKHGLEWSAPRRSQNPAWSTVAFGNLFNPKWVEGVEDVLINEVWNMQQQYQEIEFKEEWRDKQIVLNGYWQSWKYFDHCKDEVYKAFNLPYEFREGVCGVHVRRGDYLVYDKKHPTVTPDYLIYSMYYIRTQTGVSKFKVYSDDIPWCKWWFGQLAKYGSDIKIEYSEGKTPLEDLTDMSFNEHQIISNSTLAWWAGELNRNPNKIVVCPSEANWFGYDNKLTVKDLLRPEWHKVSYTPIYELKEQSA